MRAAVPDQQGVPLIGILTGLISLIVIILLVKFVLRPDVSKLKNISIDMIRKQLLPPMSIAQKLILGGFFLLILFMLLPDLITPLSFLSDYSACFPIIFILILAALFVGDKAIVDVQAIMSTQVGWGTIFMVGQSLLLGTALTADSTGIKALLASTLMPLFNGMSTITFMVVFLLLTFVLTNVCNSMVICMIMESVLLTYADDMGYGDLSCLNPESKIQTPNLDRIADEGMICTDMHASSAMCTPSRYALLTGRYNWRSELKKEVLSEAKPHLIELGRLTLPELLRRQGYTGYEPFPHMGVKGKLGWSYGPIAPNFHHEDVVPDFNQKVLELLDQYAQSEQPFFLYYPTPAVHIPLVPTREFRGKSGIGEYGDFVLEQDYAETRNVCDEHPEIVESLRTELIDIILRGRSTPGAPQKNTVEQWPEMMWVYDYLPQDNPA